MQVPYEKVGPFLLASISPTQSWHEPDWETDLVENQFSPLVSSYLISLQPVSSFTHLLPAQGRPQEHAAKKTTFSGSPQIGRPLASRDPETQHKLSKLGEINKRVCSYQDNLESVLWVSALTSTAFLTMCHHSEEAGPDLSKVPKCTPVLPRSHRFQALHALCALFSTLKTSSSSQVYRLLAQCC